MPTWLCIGAGALVLLIGVFALIGALSSGRRRKNAPDSLERARSLFSEGEQYEALKTLKDAFWVPVMGEYEEPEDAQTAYGAVSLLDDILADMNLDASKLLDPLLEQLEAATVGGGTVDEELSHPVEDFLERAAFAENLRDDLEQLVREGLVEVEERQQQESAVPPEAGEMDIINKVGRFMLRGQPDKAVEFVDRHIEGTEGRFRAEILNQRGGANFMAENFEAALADYEECAQIQPENAMHYSNAAEAAEKLGDSSRARAFASRALEVGGDRDAVATAEDVLSRN